jgi:hypothetical protein
MNANKEAIKELKTFSTENKDKITSVDTHYKDVCDAILKTNGIMVKDLEGHNIF